MCVCVCVSFQIKCASLKILECNIETNMHYVQFILSISLISFPFNVDILKPYTWNLLKMIIEFIYFKNNEN